MARDFAQLHISMWDDPTILDLSVPAQWLYMVLISDPKLSYAGVTDWYPRRLKTRSATASVETVEAAADELAEQRLIIIDEGTDEVMVRSRVRADKLLKMPNMGAAVSTAYTQCTSRMIKGVIVHELQRLAAENPGWKSWEALEDVLQRPSLDPFRNPSGNPSGNPSPNPSVNPSGKASGTG